MMSGADWNAGASQHVLWSHAACRNCHTLGVILLMEEIRNNHLGCKKPYGKWDILHFSTGFLAGFLNHQQYWMLLKKKAGHGLLMFHFEHFEPPQRSVDSQQREAPGRWHRALQDAPLHGFTSSRRWSIQDFLRGPLFFPSKRLTQVFLQLIDVPMTKPQSLLNFVFLFPVLFGSWIKMRLSGLKNLKESNHSTFKVDSTY